MESPDQFQPKQFKPNAATEDMFQKLVAEEEARRAAEDPAAETGGAAASEEPEVQTGEQQDDSIELVPEASEAASAGAEGQGADTSALAGSEDSPEQTAPEAQPRDDAEQVLDVSAELSGTENESADMKNLESAQETILAEMQRFEAANDTQNPEYQELQKELATVRKEFKNLEKTKGGSAKQNEKKVEIQTKNPFAVTKEQEESRREMVEELKEQADEEYFDKEVASKSEGVDELIANGENLRQELLANKQNYEDKGETNSQNYKNIQERIAFVGKKLKELRERQQGEAMEAFIERESEGSSVERSETSPEQPEPEEDSEGGSEEGPEEETATGGEPVPTESPEAERTRELSEDELRSRVERWHGAFVNAQKTLQRKKNEMSIVKSIRKKLGGLGLSDEEKDQLDQLRDEFNDAKGLLKEAEEGFQESYQEFSQFLVDKKKQELIDEKREALARDPEWADPERLERYITGEFSKSKHFKEEIRNFVVSGECLTITEEVTNAEGTTNSAERRVSLLQDMHKRIKAVDQARIEALSEKDRNLLQQGLVAVWDWYKKVPKKYRILAGSVLAGGLAAGATLAGGATMGLAFAAGAFSGSRRALSTLAGGAVGAAAFKISRERKDRTRGKREKSKEKKMAKEYVKGKEVDLYSFMKDRLAQEKKDNRNSLIAAGAAGFAVGAGTRGAFGIIDSFGDTATSTGTGTGSQETSVPAKGESPKVTDQESAATDGSDANLQKTPATPASGETLEVEGQESAEADPEGAMPPPEAENAGPTNINEELLKLNIPIKSNEWTIIKAVPAKDFLEIMENENDAQAMKLLKEKIGEFSEANRPFVHMNKESIGKFRQIAEGLEKLVDRENGVKNLTVDEVATKGILDRIHGEVNAVSEPAEASEAPERKTSEIPDSEFDAVVADWEAKRNSGQMPSLADDRAYKNAQRVLAIREKEGISVPDLTEARTEAVLSEAAEAAPAPKDFEATLARDDRVWNVLKDKLAGDEMETARIFVEFKEATAEVLVNEYQFSPDMAKEYVQWRLQNLEVGDVISVKDEEMGIEGFVGQKHVDEFLNKKQGPKLTAV